MQIFRLATARIKIHEIPHVIFWNQEFVFLQALHHSSVSRDVTLLYFFIENFIFFRQKEPIKVQIFRLSTMSWELTLLYFFSWNFIWLWKLTKFQSHLKSQVSFTFSSLDHSSESWELTLLYFFSWNFILFGQKEPIRVWNFRLSTDQVKIHQICTLISSFLWKYTQFQQEKYNAVTCKDTEDWWKIWRGLDLLFQNWHEKFDEYWLEHSKSLNKVYNQSI